MRDYQAVTTHSELDSLVAELTNSPLVAFDVETGYTTAKPVEKRALDLYHPDFICVGFSVTNDPTWARYVPLRHDSEQFFEPLEVWERMRPVLENHPLLAHHKKFEDRVLRGLPRQKDAQSPIRTARGHDSMLAAYVSGQFKMSNLKDLTKVILGEDQATFASLFTGKDGKPPTAAQVKRSRFNQLVPLDPKVISYACDDSALSLAIYQHILRILSPFQFQVYNLELAISALMVEAEDYGIGVAWEDMRQAMLAGATFRPKFEEQVREDIAAMTADPRVQEQARTANLASSLQMRKLLYGGLHLSTTRLTEKGELSTDAQALEGLSRKHPGVRGLLDLREVDNLLKRIKKWTVEYAEGVDARIHPGFAQTQVVTGRFSANDPAVQQLPKTWLWSTARDDALKPLVSGTNGEDFWQGNFREFICAADGHYLLLFDYSQIELRVLAGVTQEPTLLDAFRTGKDPHTATAAMMLGIPLEFVGEHERSKGKTLNFAILYGMGPKSMAERLAITLSEAKDLEDAYKAQFSNIDAWTSSQKSQGLRDKYVTTWLGRVVPLWNAWSAQPAFLAQAERLAVNAPIQGGASDYVKIAMLRCQAVLKQHGLWGPHGVMLTMNQHDSLAFEVDNSVDPNFLKKILHEAVVFDPRHLFPQMTVPAFPSFEVEWEIGLTWGSADKWKGDVAAVWSDEHAQWHLSTADPQPIPNVSPLTREEIVLSLPDVSPLNDTPQRLVISYPDWDAAFSSGVVGEEDQANVASGDIDRIFETKARRTLLALSGNYPGENVTQVTIGGQIVAASETCLDEGYKGMLQIVFPGCAVSLEDG